MMQHETKKKITTSKYGMAFVILSKLMRNERNVFGYICVAFSVHGQMESWSAMNFMMTGHHHVSTTLFFFCFFFKIFFSKIFFLMMIARRIVFIKRRRFLTLERRKAPLLRIPCPEFTTNKQTKQILIALHGVHQ